MFPPLPAAVTPCSGCPPVFAGFAAARCWPMGATSNQLNTLHKMPHTNLRLIYACPGLPFRAAPACGSTFAERVLTLYTSSDTSCGLRYTMPLNRSTTPACTSASARLCASSSVSAAPLQRCAQQNDRVGQSCLLFSRAASCCTKTHPK